MRRKGLILSLLFLSCLFIRAQYNPDILGGNYISRIINMPDDYDGKVICTLIKKPALPDVKQAILYIHGYNDYFFQKELGDSIEAHGYNFYALDLRKYGRSLLPHQDAFFCKNLSEYYADIDTALSVIKGEGNDRIILMGHSTGGLISSIYLYDTGETYINGLILNSPFLDMNMSPFLENIATPLISFMGRIFPRIVVQKNGSHSYAHSLLAEHKGEWDFNTEWKKVNGHPKRAGWIKAIHQGHKKVQNKVSLKSPILLLSSDKSFREKDEWHDLYSKSDIVLDVDDIRKYGTRLGDNVTYVSIPDGIHDLILSKPKPRKQVYHTIFEWLDELP